MAGHAELQGQNLGQLQVKAFPESVVYQRGKENLVTCMQSASYLQLSPVVAIPTTTTTTGVKDTSTAQKSGRTKENLNEAKSQTVMSQAEMLHKAPVLANLGNCEQAIHFCQQALQVDSLSVTPYYLLVHIAEEQGNIEQVKKLLKRIIYLLPKSIPAYLKLSDVYEREGDSTRAKKMLQTGFELLKELPSHVLIEQQHEVTAGELIFHVKKLLIKYIPPSRLSAALAVSEAKPLGEGFSPLGKKEF